MRRQVMLSLLIALALSSCGYFQGDSGGFKEELKIRKREMRFEKAGVPYFRLLVQVRGEYSSERVKIHINQATNKKLHSGMYPGNIGGHHRTYWFLVTQENTTGTIQIVPNPAVEFYAERRICDPTRRPGRILGSVPKDVRVMLIYDKSGKPVEAAVRYSDPPDI